MVLIPIVEFGEGHNFKWIVVGGCVRDFEVQS